MRTERDSARSFRAIELTVKFANRTDFVMHLQAESPHLLSERWNWPTRKCRIGKWWTKNGGPKCNSLILHFKSYHTCCRRDRTNFEDRTNLCCMAQPMSFSPVIRYPFCRARPSTFIKKHFTHHLSILQQPSKRTQTIASVKYRTS